MRAHRQRSNERILSILSAFRRDNQAQKLGQIPSCVESGFPICLSEGLLKVFGAEGKKCLDAVVMKSTFEQPKAASQKDICDLYARYTKRLSTIIGESPSQVIKYESFKLMESKLCTKCPLYQEELRRHSSSD